MQRRERKEIHDWSESEFASFHKALRRLKDNGYYDELIGIHAGGGVHSNDMFLPWHRKFLEDLETRLQMEAADCDLTLPFWNWARERGNIEASETFWGTRFGPLKYGYVTAGVGANFHYGWWQSWLWYGYLWRNPDDSFFLADWATLAGESEGIKDYREFREYIESVHNAFHVRVGGLCRGSCGQMGDLTKSPLDPLFFVHHAFIDSAWVTWQKWHPNSRMASLGRLPSGLAATSYVGEYDSSRDCVKYPASDPRICLSYKKRSSTGRRLSNVSSNDNQCGRLLAQIDAGECSPEELRAIPRIDECGGQDEDAMWAHSMEVIRNSTHVHFRMEPDSETSEAADRNEMLEWIAKRREQDRMRQKAASRPAMNAEEKTVCLACDFVCARPGGGSGSVGVGVDGSAKALVSDVAGATLHYISSVNVGIVSVAVLTPIMM